MKKQFLQKNMAFVSPLNIRIGFPIKKYSFICFDESIPFIAPLPRDEFGLQRSLWMGAQDITKLINFVYDNAAQYGIDNTKPNYLGGSSGGGSASLYSVFADLESERPAGTFYQGHAVECDYDIEMVDLGPMPKIKPSISGVFVCNTALDVDIINYGIFDNQDIPLVLFGQKWDPAIPASTEPERIFHLFGLPLPNTFPYSYGPNGLSKLLSNQNYDHLVIERNDFLSHSTGYLPSLMEEIFGYFCEHQGERMESVPGERTSESINEIFDSYKINIGPNPTSDFINIHLNNQLNQPFAVSIFNAMGDLLIHDSYEAANSIKLDVDFLNTGIYFIQINTAAGQLVKTEKVVIR
ncbi:MAG: T9SS type A sorting domain-containing protein [Chitinophagales bacterium]